MRKILSAVLTMILLFTSVQCFAVAPEDLYTEYKFYTASVYICNPENQTVILRNVKPVNAMDGLVNARAIEYTEVRINKNCIFDKNGKRLSLEDVNGGFLDIETKVLTGKNRNGQRVLCISF